MKVDSSYCQRVTKDVVCSVVISEDVGFTMCGEIINGDIEESSIAPTFYQSSEFKRLACGLKICLCCCLPKL